MEKKMNNYKKEEENRREEATQISFDILGNIQKEKKEKGENLNKFVDDYVLVDIETTGFSPVKDNIIEIGAIKVKNNEIISEYNELIKIDKILSPFTTKLTGITDEMLQSGKNITEVLKEFVKFSENKIIIGHNVTFDLGFLNYNCRKYLNYNLNNDYVDTMCMARKIVPNSINYKLGTLANLFNVSYEGAHRGLKDVQITYEVYNNLRKIEKNML
jgi:DNA polymerase-3 subunit epsilon